VCDFWSGEAYTCLVRSSVTLTVFHRVAARFRLAKSKAAIDVSED
jgi:hypothetical protein